MDNLINLGVNTEGSMETVTLSKKDPNYKLIDPVILSKHFSNCKTKYEILYNIGKVNDNILEWKNIPLNTKELDFRAEAKNKNIDYFGDHTIPIRWVE